MPSPWVERWTRHHASIAEIRENAARAALVGGILAIVSVLSLILFTALGDYVTAFLMAIIWGVTSVGGFVAAYVLREIANLSEAGPGR